MSQTIAPSHSVAASGSATMGATTSLKRQGRLTVNAAFLKEIKDDNRQLKSLWDNLLPLFSYAETAMNHWDEIMDGLSELRDQLALHFSLEEAFGYFDEAVDIAPRLSLTAESLRGQHTKLFAQIRDLADHVAEIDEAEIEHVKAFLRRFRKFQTQFERHEESELKLILQSLDDDIGECD